MSRYLPGTIATMNPASGTQDVRVDAADPVLTLELSGEIWYWRGPAPFYFVTVPPRESREIRALASEVTYGWGMIPVFARIGETSWYTAMFAKDGGYVLPVKAAVRRAEDVDDGDIVNVTLSVIAADRARSAGAPAVQSAR